MINSSFRADQVKQEHVAGFRKRQVAQFIKNHSIDLNQLFGQIACLALQFRPLPLVDKVHRIEESDSLSLMDGCHAQDGRDLCLARTGAIDQDQVV